MAAFAECVDFAMRKLNIDLSIQLKEKQLETLERLFYMKDTVSVLPTGYGKSLIYQLMPYVMQFKFGRPEPLICIVVCQLNSIMDDQIQSLKHRALSTCVLSFDGNTIRSCLYEDNLDEASRSQTDGQITNRHLQDGQFQLLFCHPEALKNKDLRNLFVSQLYQERVCGVVIDEVHMLSEWGNDFRPAFKQLGDLTCLFPNACHLALTATIAGNEIKELSQVLQYEDPCVVAINPDRPNIYIEKKIKLSSLQKYDKYDNIIQPIAKELREKLHHFPVTIMYVESLEALGYYYQYLSHFLQDVQYVGDSVPENRIFAQYHKDYTSRMKHHIIQELSKEDPKLRLVLATVALGMGLNAKAVTRIVHCRPPTTMEA